MLAMCVGLWRRCCDDEIGWVGGIDDHDHDHDVYLKNTEDVDEAMIDEGMC